MVEVVGVEIDTMAVPMTDIATNMIENTAMTMMRGTQGLQNESGFNMMTIMLQCHHPNHWVDLLQLHRMSQRRENYDFCFHIIST